MDNLIVVPLTELEEHYAWTIEKTPEGYDCMIAVDEGKIEESHPVDTIYYGFGKTMYDAITDALTEVLIAKGI